MSYIGETLRQVKARISEHNSKSKSVKSEVASHILTCQSYQSLLKKECPNPNRSSGILFLRKYFHVRETNLSNYYDRQIAESLHITIGKPNLNIQGSFKRLETLRWFEQGPLKNCLQQKTAPVTHYFYLVYPIYSRYQYCCEILFQSHCFRFRSPSVWWVVFNQISLCIYCISLMMP